MSAIFQGAIEQNGTLVVLNLAQIRSMAPMLDNAGVSRGTLVTFANGDNMWLKENFGDFSIVVSQRTEQNKGATR